MPDVVERSAGQRRLEPIEHVAGEFPALGDVAAERAERHRVGATRADAEVEAATADRIEHGGILGEPDRILQAEHHHARPEPDAPCPCGRGGEQDERRREAAEPGLEVMLGDPPAVEAEFLRGHEQLDDVLVERRRRAVAVDVGEEAELERPHGSLDVSHAATPVRPPDADQPSAGAIWVAMISRRAMSSATLEVSLCTTGRNQSA